MLYFAKEQIITETKVYNAGQEVPKSVYEKFKDKCTKREDLVLLLEDSGPSITDN